MAGKKTPTAAKATLHVVREAEFKKDPAVLWDALETHARVQVLDAKRRVIIDAAGYGGDTGFAWAD